MPKPLTFSQRFAQRLRAWRTAEIYLTFHGRDLNHPFSLYLSDLVALPALLENFADFFTGKHLLFYFGLHASPHAEDFFKAGLPLTPFEYEGHTLYELPFTAPHLAQIEKLPMQWRDLWCLTQTAAPDSVRLKTMGILAGPAACEHRHPDLQGEVLINYFTDPSFHGTSAAMFRFITQNLFTAAFARLYKPLQPTFPPLARLDVQQVLGFGETPAQTAFFLRSFRVSGGDSPTIARIEWPGNNLSTTHWHETHWEPLQKKAPPIWGVIPKILSRYIILVLLLPVAIIVIPLTVVLWVLRMGIVGLKKAGKRWRRQADSNR